MNPIKTIYCRSVQAVFRAALPVLPYREPEIFRSYAELGTVFARHRIQRVLIVTDEGIVRSGIAAGVCAEAESDEEAAGKCIRAIQQLSARMGILAHLEGIAPEDIPVMAAHAEREANPLYPVPRLMTKDELESFYCQVSAVPETV